jgi:AsmA protein
MSGILDNPDAAYAKLREMGKGLFGPNGGGLGGLLGTLGGLSGNQSGSSTSGSSGKETNGGQGLLGGKLGESIGNMIQQGLGGGGRGRSIPPIGGAAAAPEARHRRCRRRPSRRPTARPRSPRTNCRTASR